MTNRVALVGVVLLSTLFTNPSGVAAAPTQDGAPVQGAGIVLPIVKRDSLLNGLQIIFLERKGTGAVKVRLRVYSGAMFDLAGKGGLAEMAASMFLKGGGGLDARSIKETAEQAGISINLDVGWDGTDLVMSGPSDSLETIFDLIGKMVITPAFDQKEFEATKSARIDALKGQVVGDRETALRKSLEVVYGSHPFGRPSFGTVQSVAQITQPDLIQYHKRFFIANNAVLMVSGDAASETVTRLARAKLGSWRKGERVPATFRPAEPAKTRRVLVIDRGGAQSSEAVIAQLGLSRRDADYFVGLVMAEVLGRMVSEQARQAQATAETKLDARYLQGPLVVAIKATPGSIPTVIEGVIGQMRLLQTAAPTLDHVEAAKRGIVSSFAKRLRSGEGAADILLDIELYGLGRDYMITFTDRVNAITPSDVQRMAKALLKPEGVAVVVTAPSGDVEPALKKLGDVTILR